MPSKYYYCGLGVLLLTTAILAQSLPEFAAASVRESARSGRAQPLRVDPVRLSASGVTLQALLLRAYGIEQYQLQGAPGWFALQRFDIQATTTEPEPIERQMLMLRKLLQERFRLSLAERNTNEAVLELALAPSGLKARKLLGNEARVPPRKQDAPGQMTISQFETMPQLVAYLNRLDGPGKLARRVVDRTGLSGRFNLWLTLRNEPLEDGRPGGRLGTEEIPSLLKSQLG